jgi:hypothetical protein
MRAANNVWRRLWAAAAPAAALTEQPLLLAARSPRAAVGGGRGGGAAAMRLVGLELWDTSAEVEKSIHFLVRAFS